MALQRGLLASCCLLAARALESPGEYEVGTGSFKVPGYVCPGSKTVIYYPKGSSKTVPGKKGPFPVVAYAHGVDGYVSDQEKSLSLVASFGLTVVAPYTAGSGSGCGSSTEWKDLVTMLKAIKGDSGLHSALKEVDWSNVGLWGMSMGAKSIGYGMQEDAWGAFKLRAVLLSHGARKSSALTLPSMFVTGTKDDSSTNASLMQREFDECKAGYKVLLDFKGEKHEETVSAIWGARFLACHLKGERPCCDHVDSICNNNKVSLKRCSVQGKSSKLIAV